MQKQRENQETRLKIQNLNDINIDDITTEEMNKLKAENQQAVVLEKELEDIKDNLLNVDTIKNERRGARSTNLKSEMELNRSKERAKQLHSVSQQRLQEIEKINSATVRNEIEKEINEDRMKQNEQLLESERQKHLAQEKYRQKTSEEYNNYVLESAKLQRQIQLNLEERERLELENKRKEQFDNTFAIGAILQYCREMNIPEEEVYQSFGDHFPNIRSRMKPNIVTGILEVATERSKIMSDRHRRRHEILISLEQIQNRDQIFQEYMRSTNGVNLFGEESNYLTVTDAIFNQHMNLMEQLISNNTFQA